MKELGNAVQEAFAKIAKEGKIEVMIEKELCSTISTLISNTLRSYSDFGKALEEKVKKELQIDLSKINLDNYNNTIMKMISAKMNSLTEEKMQKTMDTFLNDLLKDIPDEVKLSKLLDDFREHVIANQYSRDHDGEFTLMIEDGGNGYKRIYFDPESGKSKYACKYCLATTDKGEIYNITIDSEKAHSTLFCGPHYSFEAKLFHLYTNRATLIIDTDESDNCYNEDY
jgi:hypothetical protein